MPDGLTRPDVLTSSSWRTGVVKPTADFGKTTAVATDAGEDLLDNSCLFSYRFKSRLAIAFANRNISISERTPDITLSEPLWAACFLPRRLRSMILARSYS